MTMTACGFELQHESFAALVQTVEGTTSLVTLRKIEATVDTLQGFYSSLSGLAKQARTQTEAVRSLEMVPGRLLDERGEMIGRLKACADGLECSLPDLKLSKDAIDRDGNLKAHHCELLHASYDDVITSAQSLIVSMMDLRKAVIRFDSMSRACTALAHNTNQSSVENFAKLERAEVFTIASAHEAFVTKRQR